MSFIDLTQSTTWSESDISSRVLNLIRSQVSQEDEMKAARLYRKEQNSQTELEFISFVDSFISECISEGRAARVDAALLYDVLEYEKAISSLKETTDDLLIQEYTKTTQEVQPKTLELFKLRNKEVEVNVE